MTEISVTVNGKVVVEDVEPRLLLTDFLRHRLGLTGTHVGCEHGVCGACTVRLDGVSVRGCCLLAVQADGSTVETVESLAGEAMLSPLQDAFKRHHALQCGFCTPGILIAADDLLSRGRAVARGDRRHALRATSAAAPATRRSSPRSRMPRVAGSRAVNLAQSLLDACERHPELGGVPRGSATTSCCRGSRGSPAGSGSSREPASPSSSTTALETALLYWACQWAGAVCVPLSWRLSEDGARLLHRRRRAPSARDPGRRPAPRRRLRTRERSTATTARSRSSSTPRARPGGRRASRARTRPTGPAASARRSSTATASATAPSA